MNKQTDLKTGTTRTTRRKILQLGSLAFAGAASSTIAPPKVAAVCCDPNSVPATSVFTTVCNTLSAEKYQDGDSPATFRLAALWLLLTTSDWTKYLKDGATEEQFKAGLVTDLGLDASVVDTFWKNFKDNYDTYTSFRSIWENQTADDLLYGKRPCIGGKSALQIACLATTAKPPAVKPTIKKK